MLQFSRLALATALLAGAGGLALTTPAQAKKETEAAGPKLSPEFRAAAQAAQTALKGTDTAAIESTVSAAAAAAEPADDHY